MKRVLLLTALLLAACASGPHWVRPDTPQDLADRDDVDCQRWARMEASNIVGGFYDSPGTHQRTISRGEPGFDVRGTRQMNEVSLTDSCMRSKGYQHPQ